MAQNTDILTYCHIGKVGGKQFQRYMRSYFGFRYRGVDHAVGGLYKPEDLRIELRFNPWIRYLGGHDVRPHVDFGQFEHRLKWFSIFRDPLDRLLSHYKQQVSNEGAKGIGLMEWIEKNPNRTFWNTYMISGGDDHQAAIEIIKSKYAFVGLNEKYEESLLLFKKFFSLDGLHFIDKSEQNMQENSGRPDEIEELSDLYKKELLERLEGDIKLYQFAREVYDKQVNQVGESILRSELESLQYRNKPGETLECRNGVALGLDHLFWRNLSRIRRLKARHA